VAARAREGEGGVVQKKTVTLWHLILAMCALSPPYAAVWAVLKAGKGGWLISLVAGGFIGVACCGFWYIVAPVIAARIEKLPDARQEAGLAAMYLAAFISAIAASAFALAATTRLMTP
jgi:hypothetical protein